MSSMAQGAGARPRSERGNGAQGWPAHERSDEAPEDLLARIAQGDQGAFKRLYEMEASRLYGIALRIVRDRTVSGDVIQEVFLQVWSNASRYDRAGGVARAWLTGLVRYRALDAARARGRELLRGETSDLDLLDDRQPVGVLADEHERHALAQCIEELDPDKRKVVLLAFVAGYSHTQVAERLDVPIGTVKAWIRRGLLALKACLEQ